MPATSEGADLPHTAASSPVQPAHLRFGRFEILPRERRLLVNGQPANIGARAFDLLNTLVERSERVVSKNELIDLVWPGLVVEEGNLHVQMSTLRKVLGSEIIVTVPGRGYRFTAVAQTPGSAATRPATAPKAPPSPPSINSLPAIAGRLIGRDAELALLESTLGEPGCITLVGPGGVGKTRLATAVAQRWDTRRVWLDLAPLTEGVQIAGALARALGLPLADGDAGPQLAGALAGERVLLVLDNAEHLIESCSALAVALLEGLPQLHLLVTSQLALAIPGEHVLRVEPLAVESDEGTQTAGDGAMALLVERVADAGHRARIEPGSEPLLREICRQLDGMPLALEMAAARVPLLGLKGVRDELAQRFALLTTGHRHVAQRHRTLHAALDWSFNLLGEEEQQLFAALGVFAGGFNLELCVALAGNGAASRWEVIERLAALVDRSLVVVGHEEPPRYRLLETMRAYALEKLAGSGAEQAVRRRHAEVMHAFMADHAINDLDSALSLRELDNVREALAWAQPNAPELAVGLVMATTRTTTFTPWRGQAFAWMKGLEPLMTSPRSESLALELRVRWWNEFARSMIIAMNERSEEIARKARALARTLGDPMHLFVATGAVLRSLSGGGPELDEACAELVALGAAHPEWPPRMRLLGQGALAVAALTRRDFETLLSVRREEAKAAREAGLQMAADAAETNITVALDRLGRYEEAAAHADALVRRLEGAHSANLIWAWEGLLTALLNLQRFDEVRSRIPKALAACREFESPICTPALARLALGRNRAEAAARLLGHALQAFEQRGVQFAGDYKETADRISAEVTTLLGAGAVDKLVREGRALGEAEALELACGE
jgi:non-specific serine/threonine protein kinase